MFFVIHCNDGNTTVRQMDREQLKQELNKGLLGDNPVFRKPEDLQGRNDPNYWKGAYLIIEGAVFIPKPKQVVKEYEV